MTVRELEKILRAEVRVGRGDLEVYFDTEARKATCHLVNVHHAGYQGPGIEDFVLFPDWHKGEFE